MVPVKRAGFPSRVNRALSVEMKLTLLNYTPGLGLTSPVPLWDHNYVNVVSHKAIRGFCLDHADATKHWIGGTAWFAMPLIW